ncbi:MAG: NUDIX hydrolase [Nanoarchaeota archaeon]|nr:NUDIX hydrolase [Nanoarchaeota archaeon]
MNFGEEIVDIVDKDDNIIGTTSRKDEKCGKHILRSASVLLINEDNKVLLQLRSKNSKRYPLHWDVSGGGHVNSKESYEDCAKRELYEEIGVKIESIQLLGKHFFILDDKRKRVNSSFISQVSSKNTQNITIDLNEVEKYTWFSKLEIEKMIENKVKFHPECEFLLQTYIL